LRRTVGLREGRQIDLKPTETDVEPTGTCNFGATATRELGIRLRKSTSLPHGVVVRIGDDFPLKNCDGGEETRVFWRLGALRFARHGRAPKFG